MRLENITWPRAERYLKEDGTVIIGIGSIESHGRHMPLGTDTLIPDKLLAMIEEKTDVLIAPTIPYGATQSLNEYPGTVDIDNDVLYRYLLCVMESLRRHGAGKFLILNGHGGGEETAAILGINPALVDRSEIGPALKLNDISGAIKATGFYSVSYKGVSFNVPRQISKITDSGWIGPDHPGTATEEWGKKMLAACADYIADLAEEFRKVKV